MSLYYLPVYRLKYPSIMPDDFIPINALNNVTDMVEKLTSLLELPVEEYKERETASAELHQYLRKYYPNCLLVMFGSSINGFGVKNCDLDLLFLPFPEYTPTDQAKTDKSDIPEGENILSGVTSREALYKLDSWSHFKFLKSLFRKDKSIVKRIVMIPAKNPTLKLHLANHKVICDLHISNKLVIFNSELLQFLEKVDPRVKPLVMTLCFWAKSLGFIKRSMLSNYAFTLLVVFYLQNTDPPILPSIQFLIENAGFSRMSAGWQTAFSTDLRLIKKSRNTKSLSELFINFFQFYWNFDFVQNVVSPNSGKFLPVKSIKDSIDEKMEGFEMAALNIQDPFVLSHNVCKIETPIVMFKFSFLIAHQMLQNMPEKYKFSMLFESSEYQKVFDSHYARYIIGRPKLCLINLDYECMNHISKSSKFSLQLWYERAAQAVYEVLQYGLLIECEVTDKMNWGKNMAVKRANENGWKCNVKENSKPNSEATAFDLELVQSVQCVVYSRTWMGRKKFAEIQVEEEDVEDFNSPALKAEHSVSRELIRKNPLLNRSVPLMCFKCDCYKHTSPQISNLVVMFKPLTLSREFYQVSAFLSSYIPKTVKKILLTN